MARAKTLIDWKIVDDYLKAQCDGVGIAGVLGIHPNTLYRLCEEVHGVGFGEYSQRKKSEGKELLRARQFQVAMAGDKTMLVWLGKQYLDQKETINQNTQIDMSKIEIVKTVVNVDKAEMEKEYEDAEEDT